MPNGHGMRDEARAVGSELLAHGRSSCCMLPACLPQATSETLRQHKVTRNPPRAADDALTV